MQLTPVCAHRVMSSVDVGACLVLITAVSCRQALLVRLYKEEKLESDH